MKREIKFRAYNGDGWLYFTLEQLVSNQEPVLENYNLTHWSQYTGLKDKNDKEIYEGDILKFIFPNNGNTGIAPVVWEYGCWNVTDFDNEAGSDNIYNYIPDVEIIGNIYENPELLTNK